jgi:hypothetical protein
MDTPSTPENVEGQRAEVRWPVTLLTPHGPIEGETESISLSRVLVVSKSSLPEQGDLGLFIQAPNQEIVHMTSELVCTKVGDSDDNVNLFSAELQISYISESDRDFLCRMIADNCQSRLVPSAQREDTTPEVPAAAGTQPNDEPATLDVQLPVSYKKGGKTVAAKATRFSPKGCLVITMNPHPVGTVFSLKVTNPKSKKSIRVDGIVSLRKRSSTTKRWGMLIQFLNLTTGDSEELRQVLADPGQTPKTSIKSKYLDTFKEFILNKLPKQ